MTVLAYVVIGAWSASFLLDAFVAGYDAPPTVHALMMLLGGAAFGTTLWKKGKDDGGPK